MVTKRSGRAEGALISRHPATVERSRGRGHTERIRGTTNQVRIGHSVTRTQIREQGESNLSLPRGSCEHDHQSVRLWRCPIPETGTGGPSGGQSGKESAVAKSPRAALQRQAAIAAVARASVNVVTKSSAGWACPVAQTGTGGSSVGQTVKESAVARSPRAALQRQAAIAAVARIHQVLVNGSPQPTSIIERAPLRGAGENWFHPALARRCRTARNLSYAPLHPAALEVYRKPGLLE